MTFLVHTMMGITIGEVVPEPAVAFTLGLPMHVLVDKIPHFWPEDRPHRWSFQAVDVLLTLVALYWALRINTQNHNAILAAVAGSLLIDFLLANSLVFPMKWGQWHYKRQDHRRGYKFLLTDAGIALAFIMIAAFLAK